jgi:hypothetical protein
VNIANPSKTARSLSDNHSPLLGINTAISSAIDRRSRSRGWIIHLSSGDPCCDDLHQSLVATATYWKLSLNPISHAAIGVPKARIITTEYDFVLHGYKPRIIEATASTLFADESIKGILRDHIKVITDLQNQLADVVSSM